MSAAKGTVEALKALEALEEELAHHAYMASGAAGGDPSLSLSERIRDVRRLLAGEEPQWISLNRTRRMLGLESDAAVETWIQSGFLRTRTQPDGRTEVLLDDVLRDREAAEGLTAFGGRELTEDETPAAYAAGSGPHPREQHPADTPR